MPALQEQSFAASYDLSAKICTVVVIAVLVAVCIVTMSILVGVIGFCLVTMAYLYSPQSYKVSGRSILIKRLIGTVCLPLDSIRALRAELPTTTGSAFASGPAVDCLGTTACSRQPGSANADGM